jgi:hypothetical protein
VTRPVAFVLAALTLACACAQSSLPPIIAAKRVFVIVMENHSYDEALQGAYTSELEKQAGVATNYHAITHPSVPNYLALTSGQTWGINTDTYRALPPEDIGHQLTSAHIRWRAYMEGLGPGGCLDSPLPYDADHNPFAYFGGRCPSNVVPFSELSPDLAAADTRFSWFGPDRCHDQHDCSIAAGDDWLRQTVGMITSSPSWQADAVLFVTWDEDGAGSDNRVLMLVLRPDVKHRVSAVAYDHYSLLATIEDIVGVPRLANAVGAKPMQDLIA